MPETLLPPSSGYFEQAQSFANMRRLEGVRQKARILRTLWDPWTCPAPELPLLAWAMSVDIWDDAWPEIRKRQVIAEAPVFHALKTTIAADRMACGYVDAELITYHLPRDGFAVSRAPTREQYETWVGSLPEIRVYPLEPRASRFPPLIVVGRAPASRAGQIERARRAELRQGSRVQQLVVSGETRGPDGDLLTEIERVSLPKPVRFTLTVGRTPISAPIGARPASRRVFSFDWRAASIDPFDLKPGVPSLVPVEAVPRKVTIPRPHRPWRLIVGRTPVGSAIGAPPARENYYLSLRVADGTGPSGQRPRQGAIGRDRLKRAKFTKELSVLLARPRRRGWPFSGARLVPSPEAKVDKVLAAIASAQAARDRVFVNFNVVNALRVGDLASVDGTTLVGAFRLTPRR